MHLHRMYMCGGNGTRTEVIILALALSLSLSLSHAFSLSFSLSPLSLSPLPLSFFPPILVLCRTEQQWSSELFSTTCNFPIDVYSISSWAKPKRSSCTAVWYDFDCKKTVISCQGVLVQKWNISSSEKIEETTYVQFEPQCCSTEVWWRGGTAVAKRYWKVRIDFERYRSCMWKMWIQKINQ